MLLHRLYTAATMFHLMTDEQRALIGRIQTELSAFFVTKIVLKERKRKGKKRNIPPTPPIIEKKGQVKEKKNPPTAARREWSPSSPKHSASTYEKTDRNGQILPNADRNGRKRTALFRIVVTLPMLRKSICHP